MILKQTKLHQRIRESGKNWMSLSSGSWIKHNKRESKYPIMLWLNPMNQQIYNSGWFTIEMLEEWIEDKGPVIRTEPRGF